MQLSWRRGVGRNRPSTPPTPENPLTQLPGVGVTFRRPTGAPPDIHAGGGLFTAAAVRPLRQHQIGKELITRPIEVMLVEGTTPATTQIIWLCCGASLVVGDVAEMVRSSAYMTDSVSGRASSLPGVVGSSAYTHNRIGPKTVLCWTPTTGVNFNLNILPRCRWLCGPGWSSQSSEQDGG